MSIDHVCINYRQRIVLYFNQSLLRGDEILQLFTFTFSSYAYSISIDDKLLLLLNISPRLLTLDIACTLSITNLYQFIRTHYKTKYCYQLYVIKLTHYCTVVV